MCVCYNKGQDRSHGTEMENNGDNTGGKSEGSFGEVVFQRMPNGMRGTELRKEYEEQSSKQKEHHTLRPGRRKELGLLLELKGSQPHWSLESQERQRQGGG